MRRMAYSLKRQSRTLVAEIDLPNPEDLLRPGMYAYAAIQIERTECPVLAVIGRRHARERQRGLPGLLFRSGKRQGPADIHRGGHPRRRACSGPEEADPRGLARFQQRRSIRPGRSPPLADGQEVTVVANQQKKIQPLFASNVTPPFRDRKTSPPVLAATTAPLKSVATTSQSGP